MGPILVFAALIAAVLLLLYRLLRNSYGKTVHISSAVTGTEKNPYNDIQSLPAEFDWAATPPLKIWPFKPKYHLSMGQYRTKPSYICSPDRREVSLERSTVA